MAILEKNFYKSKNITQYSFDNFDPNQLNWFSVDTEDILGLKGAVLLQMNQIPRIFKNYFN